MRVNVWLVYKQGEPRIYTWTFLPSEAQLNAFRKDGFKIYHAELVLPINMDMTKVRVQAAEVRPRERAPLISDLDIIHHYEDKEVDS